MQRVYTPWRLKYLTGITDAEGCVFCDALGQGDDARAFILHRGERVFVILNLYPYSNGHVMVIPERHISRLAEASPQERAEIIETTARCEAILQEAYRPDGLNVGINLGRAAGAGIEGHLHVHVVPRWGGDTNFATVLGNARFIPETPQQTYDRLAPLFRAAGAGSGS